MSRWPRPRPARPRIVRLGLATHDDRFFTPIKQALDGAGAVVRTDPWQGHGVHHEPLSASVAAWADVVFAEWCLGNAVWHAANRRPGVRLIVRFHRFELEKDFPGELDMDSVDSVIFVGPHIRDEAIARFGWPPERCLFIPNAIDTATFDRPKRDDARFTLGMLTWERQLKRLDLALDLLEGLRSHDPRFRLRVKGPRPEDIEHVWKYPEERDYFGAQYDRIGRSGLLREAVIFDPPGDDVPGWFSGVGHVLSLSDVESFHLALAEGMASRAAPVIRHRPGVRSLFGDAWLVEDVPAAVRAVTAQLDEDVWRSAGAAARTWIADRYDAARVMGAWRMLLLDQPQQTEAFHG